MTVYGSTFTVSQDLYQVTRFSHSIQSLESRNIPTFAPVLQSTAIVRQILFQLICRHSIPRQTDCYSHICAVKIKKINKINNLYLSVKCT